MRDYKKYLYIVPLLALLLGICSCTNDDANDTLSNGEGVLCLSLSRAGVTQTKAIDSGLALCVLDEQGEVYVQYRAGSVPNKIVLEPGRFTIQAYTENQDTWHLANDGLGAACYYGEQTIELGFDETAYVNMNVPLTNYAVTLTLPVLFNELFKTHALSLKSGSRWVKIQEGQKAYFDVADGGFSYQLQATNIDEVSHSTRQISYNTVEKGKLYNLTYYYGTDANSGGLDIEITDDMETEDNYVPL